MGIEPTNKGFADLFVNEIMYLIAKGLATALTRLRTILGPFSAIGENPSSVQTASVSTSGCPILRRSFYLTTSPSQDRIQFQGTQTFLGDRILGLGNQSSNSNWPMYTYRQSGDSMTGAKIVWNSLT